MIRSFFGGGRGLYGEQSCQCGVLCIDGSVAWALQVPSCSLQHLPIVLHVGLGLIVSTSLFSSDVDHLLIGEGKEHRISILQ